MTRILAALVLPLVLGAYYLALRNGSYDRVMDRVCACVFGGRRAL